MAKRIDCPYPKYIKSVSAPDEHGNVSPEWLIRPREAEEKDPVTKEPIFPTEDELNRYYTVLVPNKTIISQFKNSGRSWKRFDEIALFDINLQKAA